jgi:hypothetical protein
MGNGARIASRIATAWNRRDARLVKSSGSLRRRAGVGIV